MTDYPIIHLERKIPLPPDPQKTKQLTDNSNNPMYTAEEEFRIFQLRNRKFIGSSLHILIFSKFISLFIYGLLFFTIRDSSIVPVNAKTMNALKYILMMAPVLVTIYSSFLLAGAYTYNIFVLNTSMALCVLMGAYDLVVAALGFTTYYSDKRDSVTTVLLYSCCCLSLEMFWVLCNDLPHLIMFKKLVKISQDNFMNDSRPSRIAFFKNPIPYYKN